MKVLVIDDEPELASIIQEWLSARGYTVDVATDVNSVPAILRSKTYDLVTLDLVMPKSSGLRWIEHIRSVSPKTAVIVVSALVDFHIAALAIKEGAVGAVHKPIDFPNLEATIARALNPCQAGT